MRMTSLEIWIASCQTTFHFPRTPDPSNLQRTNNANNNTNDNPAVLQLPIPLPASTMTMIVRMKLDSPTRRRTFTNC